MNRYTVHIELLHTFTQTEEYEAVVEADTPEEAEAMAEKAARRDCRGSGWDADHDETRIENTEIIRCDSPDGEQPIVTPRCDQTPDMFAVYQ